MAKTTTAVHERGRAIEGVGEQGAAVPLTTFLAGAGTLTLNQRKLLVDQAILLLEQNYVHLTLKVAMHAVNPVQRLRVLRARMDRQTQQTMEPEWSFHRQMSGIFHSVRDLHTCCRRRSLARSRSCLSRSRSVSRVAPSATSSPRRWWGSAPRRSDAGSR